MSRIDELIAELCPGGVEYRPIADLAKRNKGIAITATQMKAAHLEGAPIRVFAAGNTVADLPESAVPPTRVIRRPSIIVKSRGHIGFAFHDGPFTHKSELWSYTFKPGLADSRFMYHYLLTRVRELQEWARATSVKLPQLSVGDTDKLRVPVPPLAIQREIASILDKMENLEAELEAELEARARQYSFQVSRLLTSVGSVNWRPLGEMATFSYGYTAKAADVGEYRFIRITDIDGNGKLSLKNAKFVSASPQAAPFLVKSGDLLMARTGATYGKTMLVSEDTAAVYASFLIRIQVDPNVMVPSYYWHFAQSALYWDQAKALVSTGGQPQFNANVLKSVQVPVPPIDEQRRIVAILDKFDALVNDLSSGLPAEIAARRKQYEYYRDKLLNFPEKTAS